MKHIIIVCFLMTRLVAVIFKISKSRKDFILMVLLIACFCLSCSKEEVELKTLNFSINYSNVFRSVQECEVIILALNNELLHKEVIPVGVNHRFSIQSPSDKVNLVIIDELEFQGGTMKKYVKLYREVQPGTWTLNSNESPYVETRDNPAPVISSRLEYINLPDFGNEKMWFGNTSSRRWTVNHEANASTAYCRFDRALEDYAYLLIPSLAKYKLTSLNSEVNQIDASEMEDAKKITFQTKEGISFGVSKLLGYPNPGFDMWVNLGHGGNLLSPDCDLIYPDKEFLNYEIFCSGGYGNEGYEYYNLGNAVPEKINLLDESNYELSENEGDVTIKFLKEQPTYYYLNFTGEGVELEVFSSAELTSFNSSKFLESLDSRLLRRSRSAPDLNRITLTKVSPLDYQSYWNYVFTPSLLKRKKIREVKSYFKSFY